MGCGQERKIILTNYLIQVKRILKMYLIRIIFMLFVTCRIIFHCGLSCLGNGLTLGLLLVCLGFQASCYHLLAILSSIFQTRYYTFQTISPKTHSSYTQNPLNQSSQTWDNSNLQNQFSQICLNYYYQSINLIDDKVELEILMIIF